ncbi:unnamed protein product, partial [Sphacelaria rigidula]
MLAGKKGSAPIPETEVFAKKSRFYSASCIGGTARTPTASLKAAMAGGNLAPSSAVIAAAPVIAQAGDAEALTLAADAKEEKLRISYGNSSSLASLEDKASVCSPGARVAPPAPIGNDLFAAPAKVVSMVATSSSAESSADTTTTVAADAAPSPGDDSRDLGDGSAPVITVLSRDEMGACELSPLPSSSRGRIISDVSTNSDAGASHGEEEMSTLAAIAAAAQKNQAAPVAAEAEARDVLCEGGDVTTQTRICSPAAAQNEASRQAAALVQDDGPPSRGEATTVEGTGTTGRVPLTPNNGRAATPLNEVDSRQDATAQSSGLFSSGRGLIDASCRGNSACTRVHAASPRGSFRSRGNFGSQRSIFSSSQRSIFASSQRGIAGVEDGSGSPPVATYSNDSCSVCLEEYKEGEPLLQLTCGHVYHQDCIDLWLKEHCVCPCCRTDLDKLAQLAQIFSQFDRKALQRALARADGDATVAIELLLFAPPEGNAATPAPAAAAAATPEGPLDPDNQAVPDTICGAVNLLDVVSSSYASRLGDLEANNGQGGPTVEGMGVGNVGGASTRSHVGRVTSSLSAAFWRSGSGRWHGGGGGAHGGGASGGSSDGIGEFVRRPSWRSRAPILPHGSSDEDEGLEVVDVSDGPGHQREHVTGQHFAATAPTAGAAGAAGAAAVMMPPRPATASAAMGGSGGGVARASLVQQDS